MRQFEIHPSVGGVSYTYGLAWPSAEDTETELTLNVEVGMDAHALVLDEFDFGGDYGVAIRDLKLELEQLVAVDRVLGGGEVAEVAKHVVVREETDIYGEKVSTVAADRLQGHGGYL